MLRRFFRKKKEMMDFFIFTCKMDACLVKY